MVVVYSNNHAADCASSITANIEALESESTYDLDSSARQVALTEPRYLVCSGCGVARYCSEACQRVHWTEGEHQKVCPAGCPG